MAAYFHGNSEIQGGGDGLQTLILMNPAYVGYSENQQQQQQQPGNNFVFLNSNTAASDGHSLPHAPPSQTQHFVGIPLHGAASVSQQDTQQHKDVSAPYGFLAYNLYNLQADLAASRDVTSAQQGLSLSLSSQQQPLAYGGFRPEREVPSQTQVAGDSPTRGGDEVRVSGGSPSSASAVSNGVAGVQSVLFSSKYLKAAQELLDEVVNVGKGTKTTAESSKTAFNSNIQAKNAGDFSSAAAATSGDGPSGGEPSAKGGADLSTADRQEIQMKKAKLVNMLEEVDQRYRHYHHQMQTVIAWFEQNVGIGSAKTYTALALQTISKQFRCLKDAILHQIRSASRALGEDENMDGKTEGSRLKYVDNQIRQQRALQQLGMIQHNAWRPQRGLPERSVSVLRAWLFEHFLHPYPKDSDKLMLAKQTGLTRSQVSNWFINARVRLWKPMVEEMYMEEIKEPGREDKTTGKSVNDPHNEVSTSKSTAVEANTPATEKPSLQSSPILRHPTSPSTMNNFTGFNLIASSGLESIAQSSPKKLRTATGATEVLHSPAMNMPTNEDNMAAIKFNSENQSREAFTLLGAPTNFIGGFGSYSIGELGRFAPEQYPPPPYSGNGVSLTLGLPHSHCDNIAIQGPHHQSFIPNQGIHQMGRGMGVEIGDSNEFSLPAPPQSANVYENMSLQRRKSFSAQLLPEFVARKSITDFAMGME